MRSFILTAVLSSGGGIDAAGTQGDGAGHGTLAPGALRRQPSKGVRGSEAVSPHPINRT